MSSSGYITHMLLFSDYLINQQTTLLRLPIQMIPVKELKWISMPKCLHNIVHLSLASAFAIFSSLLLCCFACMQWHVRWSWKYQPVVFLDITMWELVLLSRHCMLRNVGSGKKLLKVMMHFSCNGFLTSSGNSFLDCQLPGSCRFVCWTYGYPFWSSCDLRISLWWHLCLIGVNFLAFQFN